MYTYKLKADVEHCQESRLRENANFFFIEVASGIYYVDKDRHSRYGEWEDLRTVTGALKHQAGVLVKNLSGDLFSNRDLLQNINM